MVLFLLLFISVFLFTSNRGKRISNIRIEEAKRLLTNPKDKKITVLEVMYEVGFNSKSSFNTLFKKYTGVTPSEIKRNSIQEGVRLYFFQYPNGLNAFGFV